MVPHRFPIVTALVGATALLSGCLNSDNAPSAPGDTASPEDQSAIQTVMQQDVDAAEYSAVDLFTYSDPATGASAAPIATARWRREPQDFTRSARILIQQSAGERATANVFASGDVIGLLHLWTDEGDSFAHVTKDFEDTSKLHMVFQRERERDRNRGWHLMALSGVDIASPNTTRHINSVRVQWGDVDNTITDITQLVRVPDLMQLAGDAVAEVTVDTGDATDHVFLHVRRELRLEMHNNGDGTFSARMPVLSRRGPGHFVVDVLSDGTLYDDEAPYDNAAWGIPFLVPGPRDGGSDGEGGGNA